MFDWCSGRGGRLVLQVELAIVEISNGKMMKAAMMDVIRDVRLVFR